MKKLQFLSLKLIALSFFVLTTLALHATEFRFRGLTYTLLTDSTVEVSGIDTAYIGGVSILDEVMHDKVVVMKNQGAQDLGMYDFWKDVRRVELVRRRFAKVKGGLAVFVTNDALYTKASRPTSNNYLLNMTEGKHSVVKHWQNPESTCAKTHPDFEVEKEYGIKWHQRTIDNVEFYYCIVTI